MPDTNIARAELHRLVGLVERHELALPEDIKAQLRAGLTRALEALGETRRSRRAPPVEVAPVDKRSLRGRPVNGAPQWCPNRPRPRSGQAEPVVAEKPPEPAARWAEPATWGGPEWPTWPRVRKEV